MYDANTQYVTFWSTNIGSDGVAPLAYPWQPSHAYHCNSWIYEFRGGVPVLPNVGDVGTLTISGSFSGSPVTVSHIVTAADQTALVNLYINNSGAHPITSDLVSKINANTILSTAGIHADDTQNPNRDGRLPEVGLLQAPINTFQTRQSMGGSSSRSTATDRALPAGR